jgi:RTX calcium-binding nonapeptide repeat (4 copies)
MSHVQTLRRLTLGALLAGAALIAVPAAANASTVCGYDASAKRVNITTNDFDELRIMRSGQTIVATVGGQPIFCAGGGATPTVTNTDTIRVRDSSPTVGRQKLVIDQSQGVLGPGATPELDGNSEIEIQFERFDVAPSLEVIGTPQGDTIRTASSSFVMFGNDNDVDASIRDSSSRVQAASPITVHGAGGNDFISGRGGHPNSSPPPTTVRLTLAGGPGDDTLVGGFGRATSATNTADTLFGEDGNDTLFTANGIGIDRLLGGAGFDKATFDNSGTVFDHAGEVDIFTGKLDIEQLSPVPGVGRLRLDPAAVRAQAGGVARLRMSWTHPKAWRKLRSVELRVLRGSERVGRVVLTPATDGVRADGKLALAAGSRVSHRGKTVTAKLAVRLPKSLTRGQLRVEVEATDRRGRTQIEPAAGTIAVR